MKTLNEFVHNNYVSLEGIEESLLKSISNLDNQKINECFGCCCEPCCGDKCCDPYCYPKYYSESEITSMLRNQPKVQSLFDVHYQFSNRYRYPGVTIEETKEPLYPRYVSTVDSGNFIGYMYVIKNWLESQNKKEQVPEIKENEINQLLEIVDRTIKNTDFSHLYKKEQRIFSIGFNIEENKLTNSYYDLLASEARQASLIAIAKKDVPAKHWNCWKGLVLPARR